MIGVTISQLPLGWTANHRGFISAQDWMIFFLDWKGRVKIPPSMVIHPGWNLKHSRFFLTYLPIIWALNFENKMENWEMICLMASTPRKIQVILNKNPEFWDPNPQTPKRPSISFTKGTPWGPMGWSASKGTPWGPLVAFCWRASFLVVVVVVVDVSFWWLWSWIVCGFAPGISFLRSTNFWQFFRNLDFQKLGPFKHRETWQLPLIWMKELENHYQQPWPNCGSLTRLICAVIVSSVYNSISRTVLYQTS